MLEAEPVTETGSVMSSVETASNVAVNVKAAPSLTEVLSVVIVMFCEKIA